MLAWGRLLAWSLVPILIGIVSSGRTACADAPRPNFLVILTDDQGYGDVSAYGATDVRTPNIDRIGTEGMLFTSMRANAMAAAARLIQ